MRVAIVGAGLAGSLTAALMGNRGWHVDVFEARPDPRVVKAAEGRSINLSLSTRGRTALRKVGIEGEVLAKCVPMYARMIHNHDGTTKSLPYGTDGQALLSVNRNTLNLALIARADTCPSVTFNFSTPVDHIDLPNAHGEAAKVFPRLPSESAGSEYDLVVGADGAFSRVRRALERKRGVDFSQSWLKHGYKELRIPPTPSGGYAMDPCSLHIWPKGTHMMIALPNRDHSFTVTLFMPLADFASLSDGQAVTEFFSRQFPDALPLMPTLAVDFATNPLGHLCTIRTDPWHWKSSCVLVGDAAHALVPFYGQGMNAALEDCRVLDALIDRHSQDMSAVLPDFTAQRSKEANAISDLSHANYLEMRSSVTSPSFLLRRKLEAILHRIMPATFVPLYTMVAFTNVPYTEAVARAKEQDKWLTILLAGIPVASLAALLAVPLSQAGTIKRIFSRL